MQRALELDPSHDLYAADLERLLRRIPEQHADTLQVQKGLTFCRSLSLR